VKRGCRAMTCMFLAIPLLAKKKPVVSEPPATPLDQYVQQVNERSRQSSTTTPGSLFVFNGRLADGVRDVRASQVYDLITIVVSDNSSAVSTGGTNTTRKSSLQSSITALAGLKSPTGALANLATVRR
jgi:flagellar basal body L-ring protein FlgH